MFESLDAFGGFEFFEGVVEWLRPEFDSAVNCVPLSRRGAVSGTGGRRRRASSRGSSSASPARVSVGFGLWAQLFLFYVCLLFLSIFML